MQCTVINCDKPLFGDAMCQRHYRSYHVPCLICTRRSYCKTLCMYHYRLGIEIPQPKCECGKIMFVKGKCLACFKKEFSIQTCIYNECESKIHRRGMCCKHYFRYLRSVT